MPKLVTEHPALRDAFVHPRDRRLRGPPRVAPPWATTSIDRLDRLQASLEYAPITTDVMLQAAELWARARRAGLPTTDPHALDGDCIMAAQAMLAAGPGDVVTIATENVGHLTRFVDARPWDQVVP